MAVVEQIKIAKSLGKRLRNNREKQGFNLAILASKLKITVVELVAIEEGNLYAFNKSLEKFSESAQLYATAMGINLSELVTPVKKVTSVTADEWEVSIPHFLKKKE